MIQIIPLSNQYLRQASQLANAVFCNEEILPSQSFEASIDEEKFNLYTKQYNEIKTLEYFIAIDENNVVLGTSGVYSLKFDNADSYWLGWYCVGGKYRGKGIGKLLLNHITQEVKRRGKRFLKLYTSTNPDEIIAQSIYQENGFYITDDERKRIVKTSSICGSFWHTHINVSCMRHNR